MAIPDNCDSNSFDTGFELEYSGLMVLNILKGIMAKKSSPKKAVAKKGAAKVSAKKAVSKTPIKKTASPKDQKAVKVEAVAVKPGFVLIESADGRLLSCNINHVLYEGVSIEVPETRAGGVRDALLAAGFKLK